MGRALALSKLENIKANIQGLEKNIADESAVINKTVDEMLAKHQPTELDPKMISALEEKKTEIAAQLPNINKLEAALDIQEEDAELLSLKQKMEKNIGAAKAHLE